MKYYLPAWLLGGRPREQGGHGHTPPVLQRAWQFGKWTEMQSSFLTFMFHFSRSFPFTLKRKTGIGCHASFSMEGVVEVPRVADQDPLVECELTGRRPVLLPEGEGPHTKRPQRALSPCAHTRKGHARTRREGGRVSANQ